MSVISEVSPISYKQDGDSLSELSSWKNNNEYSLWSQPDSYQIEEAFLISLYGYAPRTEELGEEKRGWRDVTHDKLINDIVSYTITEDYFDNLLSEIPTAIDFGPHKQSPQGILNEIKQHPHKDAMYDILDNIFEGELTTFESENIFTKKSFYELNQKKAENLISNWLKCSNAFTFLTFAQNCTILPGRMPSFDNSYSYLTDLEALNNKFDNPMYVKQISSEMTKILFPYQQKLANLMIQWVDEADDRRDKLNFISSVDTVATAVFTEPLTK